MDKLLRTIEKKIEYSIPSWISIIFENIPEKWHKILFDKKGIKLLSSIIKKLDDILDDPMNDISPAPNHIFEFTRLTNVENMSIVIIGQDPYPDPKHAHGLAFSSLAKKIPHSLKNIYKCLIKTKCIRKMPTTANLSLWARRGVLLINAALTTSIFDSGSHQALWAKYVSHIIENICARQNLTFLLWGKKAQSFSPIVDKYDHKILTWRHPSPMAQNTTDKEKFINCNHFKLLKNEMNWNLSIRKLVVYTDGSSEPNVKSEKAKNGYAAIFQHGYIKKLGIYGSCEKIVIGDTGEKFYSTSQRAEGTAILVALQKCHNTIIEGNSVRWDNLEIVTDSKFWINMIDSYIPKWAASNKSFYEYANSDLTTKIWDLMKKLRSHGKKIILRHVPSHGKDSSYKNATAGSKKNIDYKFNDLADVLAKRARTELAYGEHDENTEIY